jgi:hypothetical protein
MLRFTRKLQQNQALAVVAFASVAAFVVAAVAWYFSRF